MKGTSPLPSSRCALARIGAALAAALLAVVLTANPGAAQQTGAVTGQVTASGTGQPLSGVQVFVVGTEIGGLTDQDGRYRLEQVPEGQVRVRASLIGYNQPTKTVQVAAGQATTVDFALRQSAVEMDQIVVTGTPGEQQMRSLGNSLGTINADQLEETTADPSFEAMLSGSEPGVNIDLAGGEVGQGANIRIRGAASLTLRSQPLIYVDGVRLNSENADQGGGVGGIGIDSRSPPSRLNDLDPQNIEKIEVIKGPSAATLYGTEASNGVINIITKKGHQGEPRFNFSISQGRNSLPDPAEEFFPPAYFRCQGTGDCTAGEIVEFNVLRHDRLQHGNTWFQNGHTQSYNGNLSGGAERTRFFFSASYNRDEGVVPYNWKNRFNGRGNVNWSPTGTLSVQFGVGGTVSKLRSASANQPITTAIVWACPAPGCEAGSGSPFSVDGPFRGYLAYLPGVLENKVEGFQNLDRQNFSLTLRHDPLDWLDHRLTVGADFTETVNTELYRPLGPGEVGHFTGAGEKEVQQQSQDNYTFDYSATGTVEPVDGLQLATSVGSQFYWDREHWSFAEGEDFPIDKLETVSAGARKNSAEGFVENKTFGAYVQEQVSWKNRIFLTGAVRGDDNSAFGEQFDFVVYPKLSGSWVISEESFLENADWLEEAKLRWAWGKSGQQPDVFAALRTYQPATGPEGAGTVTPQTIGNPNLKPEVGEEWEAGVDASLLEGRLNAQLTYYHQRRTDAIVKAPVRPSTGFPGNKSQNVGSILNEGIEIGLNGTAIERENVNLSLRANLSTNNNLLEDLGGLPAQKLQSINYTTGWAHQLYAEGFPLGAIFLKKVVSADIEGSGADAHAVNVMCEGGPLVPDAPNISRGGGEPVPCAQAPRVYRGTPLPSVTGSFSSTLRLFERLRIYGQVDFRGGTKRIDGAVAGAHLFFRNTREIKERDDPTLLGYDALGQEGLNQAGLFDADFARLRRVSVAYDLPRSLIQKFGAESASIQLTGRNLLWVWRAETHKYGRRILDPEQSTTSSTESDPGGLSAYQQEQWPTTHRITATLQLTF